MLKFLKKNKQGIVMKPIPTYFYLDWENKKAVWLRRDQITDSMRESFVFLKKVEWKSLKIKINICTSYKGDPYNVLLDSAYKNVAFLKSHLQKCIRRSNHYKAIKTGYHFYVLDPIQMIRRISIIALEDVLPLEGYAMLVWMCAAMTKGYILSNSQVCWVLSYIYRLCECRNLEKLGTLDKYSLIGKQTYLLDEKQSAIVFSIGFRRAYGGLAGDKKMLDYLTRLWYQRFRSKNSEEWWSKLKGQQQFITPPSEKLQISEWILAAIDFHCYPGMIYNIQESYDQFTDEEIKQAIWFCSSSKTDKTIVGSDSSTKEPIDKKHVAVWKVINRKFHSLAKFYLNVNH